MPTNVSRDFPDTIIDLFSFCFKQKSAKYHYIPYFLLNAPTVLPLCLYILLLGLRRWRSRARISHTDFFTYNIVVSQLLAIVGSCVLAFNLIFHSELIITINVYVFVMNYAAIIIFQILTCVERYMAVVHPVTYLSLKSETWHLIRNVSCVYIWLQCGIQTSLFSAVMRLKEYVYLSLSIITACVVLVLFCSLYVLRMLIRPRPGDGAKSNQKSKRAFSTITAITVTLLFTFVGYSICAASFVFLEFTEDSCSLWFSVMWFSLPSTLVLPLLFMQRHGKLPRFNMKT